MLAMMLVFCVGWASAKGWSSSSSSSSSYGKGWSSSSSSSSSYGKGWSSSSSSSSSYGKSSAVAVASAAAAKSPSGSRCTSCGRSTSVSSSYYMSAGVFVGSSRSSSYRTNYYGSGSNYQHYNGNGQLYPTRYPTAFPTTNVDRSGSAGVGGKSAWLYFAGPADWQAKDVAVKLNAASKQTYSGKTYKLGQRVCQNHCMSRANGKCEDGGSNSVGSQCIYGTDCQDCGDRAAGCDSCGDSVAGRRLVDAESRESGQAEQVPKKKSELHHTDTMKDDVKVWYWVPECSDAQLDLNLLICTVCCACTLISAILCMRLGSKIATATNTATDTSLLEQLSLSYLKHYPRTLSRWVRGYRADRSPWVAASVSASASASERLLPLASTSTVVDALHYTHTPSFRFGLVLPTASFALASLLMGYYCHLHTCTPAVTNEMRDVIHATMFSAGGGKEEADLLLAQKQEEAVLERAGSVVLFLIISAMVGVVGVLRGLSAAVYISSDSECADESNKSNKSADAKANSSVESNFEMRKQQRQIYMRLCLLHLSGWLPLVLLLLPALALTDVPTGGGISVQLQQKMNQNHHQNQKQKQKQRQKHSSDSGDTWDIAEWHPTAAADSDSDPGSHGRTSTIGFEYRYVVGGPGALHKMLAIAGAGAGAGVGDGLSKAVATLTATTTATATREYEEQKQKQKPSPGPDPGPRRLISHFSQHSSHCEKSMCGIVEKTCHGQQKSSVTSRGTNTATGTSTRLHCDWPVVSTAPGYSDQGYSPFGDGADEYTGPVYKKSKSSSVGIIVGVLFGMGALLLGAIYCKKQQDAQNAKKPKPWETSTSSRPTLTADQKQRLSNPSIGNFSSIGGGKVTPAELHMGDSAPGVTAPGVAQPAVVPAVNNLDLTAGSSTSSKKVIVVAPPNSKPGQSTIVVINRRQLMVNIPPNVPPGGEFGVNVPL